MATIVNNVAYSWAMISLKIAGQDYDLSGVTSIKWNRKWNVKTNYGIGGKPINRGFGNWEYTASITMDYNTQQELRAINGSLVGLGEFDLIISFANQIDGAEIGEGSWSTHTVTLVGCLFTEDGMEASQDDTAITKEFDLNPFDIVIAQTAA